jgi:hypothetical protein
MERGCWFVGGTADSFTLFERLESKLEEHSGIYPELLLILFILFPLKAFSLV